MPIGQINGIPPGTAFESRRALHDAGVHKGLMRGIAPKGESIVLSGGYVDDEDLGDEIIYTGEGGRDPSTKRQIQDQTFSAGNLNLANNSRLLLPVRVIRGHSHKSEYSPENGYRYDGLYMIKDFWIQKGLDGYNVCRFRLEKDSTEPYYPTSRGGKKVSTVPSGKNTPDRIITQNSKIRRSHDVALFVKALYDYKCQFCGIQLQTEFGPYAEACHIQPLGSPHFGPDIVENVLCLCANCHVLFDLRGITIENDLTITNTGVPIRLKAEHNLSLEYFQYHRKIKGMPPDPQIKV